MKIKLLLRAALAALLLNVTLALVLAAVPARPAAAQSSIVVTIVGFRRDDAKKAFAGLLNVNDPSRLTFLEYWVDDTEEGGEAYRDKRFFSGEQSKAFVIPFSRLTEGHKYILRVQGVYGDLLLERAGDTSTSGNVADKYILAQQEFTYAPKPKAAFTFKIRSMVVVGDQLAFNLELPADAKVLKYDGFIVDEGGQQVGVIPTGLYTEPRVAVPIPDKMKNAAGEGKYTVNLRLETKDEQESEQTFDFRYVPPAPPGLGARVQSALASNSAILWVIVAVASLAAVALILTGRRGPRSIPTLVPPQGMPTLTNAAPVRRNRVRLRVVQSSGNSRGHEEIIARFPCVIGHSNQADIYLDDSQVSRRHIEISCRDGLFYLTDLGSKNGTWVNDKPVHANAVRPISGAISVRLGEKTVLDLEMGV